MTMAKIVSSIERTIFLASPSDVKSYRNLVPNLVKEINRGFLARSKASLKLIRFEEDAVPDFGADPQSLINSQTGSFHDLFLLILWKSIGSKTPRDISGSVEEFNNAVKNYHEHGIPKIMIFLCDDTTKPSEIDSKQFGEMSQFISGISDKALFQRFEGEEDFKDKVIKALSYHLGRFDDDGTEPPIVSPKTPSKSLIRKLFKRD